MNLPYNVQDIEKYGSPTKSSIRSQFGGRRRKSLIFLLLLLCLGLLVWLGYANVDMSFSSSFTTSSENLDMASTTSSSIPTADSVKMEMNSLIMSYPLIVFSKTYCPYSKKAKSILNSFTYKTPYRIIEVDLRHDGDIVKQALGDISGRYTFPNVFVHGSSIGGASEIENMHQQDQLSALLRSEGIIIV